MKDKLTWMLLGILIATAVIPHYNLLMLFVLSVGILVLIDDIGKL